MIDRKTKVESGSWNLPNRLESCNKASKEEQKALRKLINLYEFKKILWRN